VPWSSHSCAYRAVRSANTFAANRQGAIQAGAGGRLAPRINTWSGWLSFPTASFSSDRKVSRAGALPIGSGKDPKQAPVEVIQPAAVELV
jgi:hypothetical protein